MEILGKIQTVLSLEKDNFKLQSTLLCTEAFLYAHYSFLLISSGWGGGYVT
jgi:hypothetical protein